MRIGRFVSGKGGLGRAWIADETDLEHLIREHMGDDTADIFRDIVRRLPSERVLDKLSGAYSAIKDALVYLDNAADEIEDIREGMED